MSDQKLESPWLIRRNTNRAEGAFDPNAVDRAVRAIETRAFSAGVRHGMDGQMAKPEEWTGAPYYAMYLAGYESGLSHRRVHRATLIGIRKIAGPLSVTERFG